MQYLNKHTLLQKTRIMKKEIDQFCLGLLLLKDVKHIPTNLFQRKILFLWKCKKHVIILC